MTACAQRTICCLLLLTCCANAEPAVDEFFVDEVWAKVGELTCLKCHNAKGEAEDSRLILQETILLRGGTLEAAHTANLAAFSKMARMKKDGRSRLLAKVVGDLDHEGERALEPGSIGFQILAEFVSRANGKSLPTQRKTEYQPTGFFEGVAMVSDAQLLRRLTLSLTGRLPTEAERHAIDKEGMAALDGILDGLMTEDAFYERLKEGFNDILLTTGFEGNAEEALAYDHFEKSRLWYQQYDLSHIEDAKERQREGWKLARVYREALLREPLELIAYIVRNERPFTEIVTADYMMVSPYTARGYGIFDGISEQFKDPEAAFEYIPAKLPALTARSGKVQPTGNGIYPHAGVLTMFQYLRRYPTTETNRNRLRARMYYQHFLGIDVMELAPQVTDAAAIDIKYRTPWQEAPDCVVCHRTIDPVAGLFQDFYNEKGHYGPRKDGWFTDMFGPGLEGEDLAEAEKWRSLQWLGERTAKDPRFAVAMTEHVWYIVSGRKVLRPPQDIADPLFTPRRRAYVMQRQEINDIAGRFAAADFNLKVAFKAIAKSPFYRADGLTTAASHPHRQAELDDLGIVRILSPEQLERKIQAVFGFEWGRLIDQTAILYGGIDSKEITERIDAPSGAMGAIQRIMSNDVACKSVVKDFALPAAERRLFANIEKDIVPGPAEANARIRKTVLHLHRHVLGRHDAPDSEEVMRTVELFAAIISDAQARKDLDKRASYFCGRIDEKRVDDSHYTLRAWRAVVTYLLRQQEFLYE